VHAWAFHWKHEISLPKRVGHHFCWPGLIPHAKNTIPIIESGRMMMKILPTIIKSKHPKKKRRGGGYNEQNGRPKTKEPPKKKANDKGNIKFPNPLLLREAYQIRNG